jgi:hypothetical protein
MQDYNYIWHGCMEVTIEMSCCKYPRAAELPDFWEENKEVSFPLAKNLNQLLLSSQFFYNPCRLYCPTLGKRTEECRAL